MLEPRDETRHIIQMLEYIGGGKVDGHKTRTDTGEDMTTVYHLLPEQQTQPLGQLLGGSAGYAQGISHTLYTCAEWPQER